MSKYFTRSLAFLLVLAMAVSFLACQNTTKGEQSATTTGKTEVTTSNETTTPQSTEPETTGVQHRDPGFQTVKYNGENYRVLANSNFKMATGNAFVDDHVRDIVYLEEWGTNSINETLRDRNHYIEDTYDVAIKAVWSDTPKDTLMKAIGNLDICDTAQLTLYDYTTLLTNGGLYDLETFNQYLDLSQSCWNQNSRKNLSIANRLFFVAGDIYISDKIGTWSIMFSRDLVKDNQLENMYDIVDSGAWTYDKMYELASKVCDYDSHDPSDLFNITWGVCSENSSTYLLWYGCGYNLITKDPITDIPKMNEMDESAFDAMLDVCKIQFSSNITALSSIFTSKVVSEFEDGIIRVFKDGHALFLIQSMTVVEGMRDSEVDFGVLPLPKRDESQTTYYSAQSQTKSHALSIPKDGMNNADFVGMITQALCVESTDTLLEAYYDKTLVYKGLRREEDERMLDLIINNRVYDLSLCTTWAEALSTEISGARSEKKVKTLKTNYDRYRTNMEKAITSFLEKNNLT